VLSKHIVDTEVSAPLTSSLKLLLLTTVFQHRWRQVWHVAYFHTKQDNWLCLLQFNMDRLQLTAVWSGQQHRQTSVIPCWAFVTKQNRQNALCGDRNRPSFCMWPSVGDQTTCRLLFTYLPEFLYKTMTSKPEFLTVGLLTAVVYKMARRNIKGHLSISPPF
jgi:hypothetical protein